MANRCSCMKGVEYASLAWPGMMSPFGFTDLTRAAETALDTSSQEGMSGGVSGLSCRKGGTCV